MKANLRNVLMSLLEKIGDETTDPKKLKRGILEVFKQVKTPETKQVTVEVKDTSELDRLKVEVNGLKDKLRCADLRAEQDAQEKEKTSLKLKEALHMDWALRATLGTLSICHERLQDDDLRTAFYGWVRACEMRNLDYLEITKIMEEVFSATEPHNKRFFDRMYALIESRRSR